VPEPLLEVEGLTKRFGGVVACDGVSLDVAPGEIHALIGPNGAGKTTLLAQLSGELRPDDGRIRFLGRDITGDTAAARPGLGLARSYQVTSVFREFSVIDNVALAVQAQAGHSFRFWRPARGERALREAARAVIERVGLGTRGAVRASELAHGEQRQLEIALVLATRPRLLLLDEPTAGMAQAESRGMVELLAGLKRDHAFLLVEHDMDAVFALADRITVMAYGRVIASGAPAAIRASRAVREAYLGQDDAT